MSIFNVDIKENVYTLVGMDNTTRQATTNKQVEILFKSIVVLFSGDVAFPRRTFLEILNSFALSYNNGGKRVVLNIIILSGLGMIMSFVEITCKVLW